MGISQKLQPTASAQLMLFAEEALASPSVWRDLVRDWMERADFSGISSAWLIANLTPWCSGKTSPVSCPPNTATTSPSSSGPSRDTTLKSLRAAGVIPAFVSAPSDGSHGAYLTLNTLEFRNGGVASSLSEILAGGGGNPLEILFESESLRGHPPTRRKAGQIAPSLLASGAGANRPAGIGSEADFCIPVADTLTAGSACSAGVNPPGRRREDDSNLVVSTVDVRNMVLGADISGTLQAKENGGYSLNYINPVLVNTTAESGGGRLTAVAVGMAVRRLMPIETERLQGLPDDWTRYDADGKELSDSARYRLVGNSVAVPVVAWIARRMANAVTALTPTPAAAPAPPLGSACSVGARADRP